MCCKDPHLRVSRIGSCYLGGGLYECEVLRRVIQSELIVIENNILNFLLRQTQVMCLLVSQLIASGAPLCLPQSIW